jgi:hypothetical protein
MIWSILGVCLYLAAGLYTFRISVQISDNFYPNKAMILLVSLLCWPFIVIIGVWCWLADKLWEWCE